MELEQRTLVYRVERSTTEPKEGERIPGGMAVIHPRKNAFYKMEPKIGDTKNNPGKETLPKLWKTCTHLLLYLPCAYCCTYCACCCTQVPPVVPGTHYCCIKRTAVRTH